MNTELSNRTILIQLIERMNDADAQQMLAYAAGYEAGRISRSPLQTSEQPRKPPMQVAQLQHTAETLFRKGRCI